MVPRGAAVYQLLDQDRDGFFENSKTIIRFEGRIGEHGPHGLRLGPDGMIYAVVGNATRVKGRAGSRSPYRFAYAGDLQKIYEDPGGHALGVEPPGGTVIRFSPNGSKLEVFAAGLRNAYDLTFNHLGDLFVHDSDMEGDLGTPWYRPSQLYHVTAGSDLGWRRGWSKWPEYFIDSVRPIAKTGQSSPTGAVCYRHVTFPEKYRHSIFLADWLNGKIVCAHPESSGASYTARMETFFELDGMTITDLAVGPDGGLYFCTGGRGTEGGVFRIQYQQQGNNPALSITSQMAQIVRMPQVDSAWAMQQRALLRQEMGSRWASTIFGIADENRNKPEYRLNAMNAMLLFGPRPSVDQIRRWSRDKNRDVRRAAISLLPLTTGSPTGTDRKMEIQKILEDHVHDPDAQVRRVACETLLRMGYYCSVDSLTPMLRSADRAEATAARRLLETMDPEAWKAICLGTPDHQQFCQMATALLTAQPGKEIGYQILVKIKRLTRESISDANFLDIIRVAQLAIVQCEIDPAKIPVFTEVIAAEFPSQNGNINRELARLLAILKADKINEPLAKYFDQSKDSAEIKLSVALHLQTLGRKLSSEDQLALLAAIESQIKNPGTGSSFPHYLTTAVEDLVSTINAETRETILLKASQWQVAGLQVLLDTKQLTETQRDSLIQTDTAIADDTSAPALKLKLAIVARLAEAGGETEFEYLRKVWRRDEHRRSDVTIGLAQKPEGKNWPYLVSSLGQVDDDATHEILRSLANIERRPRESKYYKTVIEIGYRLRHEGALTATRLLKVWTEKNLDLEGKTWKESLDVWKTWFEETYPEQAPIHLPDEKTIGKWKLSRLMDALEKSQHGNADRGRAVFASANCASCHRFAGQGEMMGPDLTLLAKRFSTREMLESILEPSQHVSDQYAAKNVVTVEGEQLLGLISRDSQNNLIVLLADGSKRKLTDDQVDSIEDATISAMPDGLLDEMSEQQVLDLFAYLNSGRTLNRSTRTEIKPDELQKR